MDEKNSQTAHRRMVARWEILRNQRRNNNSPGTGPSCAMRFTEHKETPASRATSGWLRFPECGGSEFSELTFVPSYLPLTLLQYDGILGRHH